ncbi:hypothetical protein N431DRAFT_436036 [Stipitochalara longipes BDJ]|nr:hypothetical protein N431DRAFT_436036 [Stipitochalara longipes BDJ]
MRRQQNRRLQRKDLAPPADFEKSAIDRKPSRLQTRPVKVGGAARGPRIQFREREPTTRRAAVRTMENNAV